MRKEAGLRYRCTVLLALSVLARPLLALDLQPLNGTAASLKWQGSQFIQADARGNVFLLRGDTLEVYPVNKAHELGEPVPLEPARNEMSTRSLFTLGAAISAHGDWLVNSEGGLHYFVDGHEKLLPAFEALGLRPVSVGFLVGEPATVVAPVSRSAADEARRGQPLLLRLRLDSWSAELREPWHGASEDRGTEMAHRAGLLLDVQGGRYFLARQYAYRIELRRLGRDRPLEELRLGSGAPLLKKTDDPALQRRLAEAGAEAAASGGRASVFRADFAILAIVRDGRDGRLYSLVGKGIAGEGCALDRIDWDERRVERMPVNLSCKGQVSMAAGRDGLYFAEWNGQEGRFFVSWDALDKAKWAKIKEVVFNP